MNYQHYLAACLRMLGDLKLSERQNEESVSYYRQSQEILEQLSRRNPDVLDYAADLAGVYLNLGVQLQQLGEWDDALVSIDESARLLEALAQQRETVPRYRADLGLAQREAGKLLAAVGRTAEARTRLEQSRTNLSRLVSEDPANESYTAELALTMDAQAGLEESPEPTPAEE
jgi:tetratricopeptide (TPR) repeat protein